MISLNNFPKGKKECLPEKEDGCGNCDTKSNPEGRFFRRTKVTDSSCKPKEWKSWKLEAPILSSLLGVTMGLIIAIAVLDSLSRAHSGIATISTQSSAFKRYIWSEGLLWTALPIFILSVYRLLVDAVILESSDRQPYVELWRKDGSCLEKSVLLDYRSYAPVKREYRALRNGHFLIFTSFLLSSLLSLGVSPLSGRLFFESPVTIDSRIVVQQKTYFDDVNGFQLTPPLVPIFDTVAATLIYGGAWPTWNDAQYSYQPFSTPPVPAGSVALINLTLPTLAYSAGLNCVDLNESHEPPFNLNVSYIGSQTKGQISVSAEDRGCPLSFKFLTQTSTIVYLPTFAFIRCPVAASLSRLLVIGAVFPADSPSRPTNLTALSCIPWYSTTKGQLKVSVGLDGAPKVQAFVPSADNIEIRRPEWWRSLEWQLHTPYTYDNNDDSGTTVLGSLILALARRDHPGTFFHPENLMNATKSAFTATYATLVTAYLYRTATTKSFIEGTQQVSVTRLLVSSPIAYAMISVLAATAVALAWTCMYAVNHHSILYEEPVGLLSQAGVLADSDLHGMLQRLRRGCAFDGRVRDLLKDGDLLRAGRCKFDDWQEPGKARIVLTYDEAQEALIFKEAREKFFKSFAPQPTPFWKRLLGDSKAEENSPRRNSGQD